MSTSVRKRTVAVIGGGVSGLSCARSLLAAKFNVTVFDTGRVKPGGRSSSRQVDLGGGETVAVDHAAQFFTAAPGSPFHARCEAMEKQGILARFQPGDVGCLDVSGAAAAVAPKDLGGASAFYGRGGMSTFVAELARGLQIRQNVWVSPGNGVTYRPAARQWDVRVKGKVVGSYDVLVIAHNGKCADRLMSKCPARQVHSLLRTTFAPRVADTGGGKMTLNSVYSLVFALPKGVRLAEALGPRGAESTGPRGAGNGDVQDAGQRAARDFVTCFVEGNDVIKLVSCNTRKHAGGDHHGREVWTVLSSAAFATKHKAPQENLPPLTVETVTSQMLDAVEACVRHGQPGQQRRGAGSGGSLKGIVAKSWLQLWGAGVPLNTYSNAAGFVYDSECSVGVVGDWLLDSSIGGAWESGRRLGAWLNSADCATRGLDGAFVKNHKVGSGIGSFDAQQERKQSSGAGPVDGQPTPQTTVAAEPTHSGGSAGGDTGRRRPTGRGARKGTYAHSNSRQITPGGTVAARRRPRGRRSTAPETPQKHRANADEPAA